MSTTDNTLANLTDCSGRVLLMGDTVTVPDPDDDERGRCGTLVRVRTDFGLGVATPTGVVPLTARLAQDITLVTCEPAVDRALRVLDARRRP